MRRAGCEGLVGWQSPSVVGHQPPRSTTSIQTSCHQGLHSGGMPLGMPWGHARSRTNRIRSIRSQRRHIHRSSRSHRRRTGQSGAPAAQARLVGEPRWLRPAGRHDSIRSARAAARESTRAQPSEGRAVRRASAPQASSGAAGDGASGCGRQGSASHEARNQDNPK